MSHYSLLLELRKKGILIGTNNKHKVAELQELLEPLAIPVKTPEDLGIKIEIEESGTTFKENAALKVKAFYDLAKMPTLADDSGLEVDALNKEPGVYSARYGGLLTDKERNAYLLSKMKHVGDYLRTARFVCVLAFKFLEEEPIRFYEGIAEGKIIYTPRGNNGFGYDPIFEDIRTKKTFAELTQEEKNLISHRGKALRLFLNDLKLLLR